jgi:hypothetical protein
MEPPWGSRLAAGYALGSLAHGGFSALVSDVDLGLILEDPLRATDRLTVRAVGTNALAAEHYLDDHITRLGWGRRRDSIRPSRARRSRIW